MPTVSKDGVVIKKGGPFRGGPALIAIFRGDLRGVISYGSVFMTARNNWGQGRTLIPCKFFPCSGSANIGQL